MGLISKFDKSLIVFFAIVFGLIFVGANVANFASNPSLPSHPLEQIDVPSICNAGEFLKINDSGDGWECAIINTTPQDSVPSGTIVMWSGTIDSIPTGWKLCDGSNGTPDLSGKFIVGYDSSNIDYNSVGKTGGLEEVTLSIDELPSHTHTMTGSTESAGSHTHTGTTGSSGSHSHSISGVYTATINARSGSDFVGFHRSGSTASTSSAGAHTHTFTTSSSGAHTHAINATINSTGGGQAHENRPPYYTIAFIMKE
jgi:microcystin-dependent protein